MRISAFSAVDGTAWSCACAAALEQQMELMSIAWPYLPQHVRDSILLLVEAAVRE
jgi:hypothetical protein